MSYTTMVRVYKRYQRRVDSTNIVACSRLAPSYLDRLLKNSLGVLRRAQDERRVFDIIEDFPFMLRLSKHSEPFSTACLSLI
jgi:hypothetical protein